MAAPLVQRVTLDAASAQQQLALLERQLATLNNPINVPVDIDVDGTQRAERQMEGLRREVDQTGDEFTQLGRKADASTDGILRVGTRGASAFTSLRGSILGVGAALAAIQGVRILGVFAGDAISAASDFEESLSKTNVVFGDLSQNIQEFASTAPEALGLSTQAALEATSTFGNLFTALGLSQQAAADLSPDVVQLAADLASFNNIDVSEAIEKLRSGLVGEVEPLRALGVSLSAATVDAKALELGLVGANGAVTEAGKVQARYALILEQTGNAQGDFARTADGIANRQRTLNAGFQNLQATIGKALLPAFESLLEVAPQLITLIEGLTPAVQSFAQSFSDAVDSLAPFLENITQIQQGIGALSDAFGVTRAIVNQSLETFTSLATLRLDDFFSNIAESGDVIGTFFDRLQDRRAIVGLSKDLEAGVEAGTAFANRLVEVAAANDVTAGTFTRLASAAGLTGDSLVEALRAIRANKDAFGLDAQAIAFVNAELLKLITLQEGFSRRQPGGGTSFLPDTTGFEDFIELSRSMFDSVSVLGDFQDQINAVNFDSVKEELGASAAVFQEFADTGDAAREALKDAEGNIVADFGDFFANLQAEIASRNAFQDNLLLLRAMGLDDLADLFQEQGLEAAGALADAIQDPTSAAQAEAFLEAQGVDQARAFNDAFRAELAALIIQQPVEVQLGQIQIPEIQAALNIGPFGGGQGVGDVIVNQTFVTEPVPTTQTQRAAQEINSIVSGQRGRQ